MMDKSGVANAYPPGLSGNVATGTPATASSAAAAYNVYAQAQGHQYVMTHPGVFVPPQPTGPIGTQKTVVTGKAPGYGWQQQY
jgi:hypothetical protein